MSVESLTEYIQLISLTKKMLIEEYSHQGSVSCSKESLELYRKVKPIQPIASPSKAVPSVPKPTFKTVSKTPLPVIEKKEPPPKPPLKKVAPSEVVITKKIDLDPIRQLVTKAHPNLSIIDQIPSDASAQALIRQYASKVVLPDVPIITMQNTPQALVFLEKIAAAIESLGASTALIILPGHEELKNLLILHKPRFVLIDREPLNHDSFLASHYEYDKFNDRHILCGHPIYPLPPVQQLTQNPHEKARLWLQLKTHLQ